MKQISDELYQELEYLGIIDNSGVRSHNIGKSNYHTKLISPWVVWLAYPELTEFDKDIVKRILRTKEGDSRKMDYEKIIHVCQERIRQIEIEEKYNHKAPNKKFSIKKGDQFRCKKNWDMDCGSELRPMFTQYFFYNSTIDGCLSDNTGMPVRVSEEQFNEYFD